MNQPISTGEIYQNLETLNFISATNINERQKLDAVVLLERSLSCILARNFIECWEELKKNYYENNNKYFIKQSIRERQDHGITLDHIENKKSSRGKYYSVHSRVANQYRTHIDERNYDDSVLIKKNKSIRVINAETEHSRANILRDIVEKLKNHKRVEDDDQQQNIQVYRKINRLEALIRSLKLEQSQERENDIEQDRRYRMKSKRQEYQNEQYAKVKSQEEQQQEKLIQQFMNEILQIRKEISVMKQTNEQLLRAQAERNQGALRQQVITQHVGHHQQFQNKVLEYDAHIEEDIKVVEKKVDKILEQLASGELPNRARQEFIKRQQNLEERRLEEKFRQEYIHRNSDNFEKESLNKIQQKLGELFNKIEENRLEIEKNKKKESNIEIVPLTHKKELFHHRNITPTVNQSFRPVIQNKFTSTKGPEFNIQPHPHEQPKVPESYPKPTIPEPYTKPIIPEPYTKPIIPEPYIKPTVPEPYTKPTVPEPYTKPAVPEPYTKPAIPEPNMRPIPYHIQERSAQQQNTISSISNIGRSPNTDFDGIGSDRIGIIDRQKTHYEANKFNNGTSHLTNLLPNRSNNASSAHLSTLTPFNQNNHRLEFNGINPRKEEINSPNLSYRNQNRSFLQNHVSGLTKFNGVTDQFKSTPFTTPSTHIRPDPNITQLRNHSHNNFDRINFQGINMNGMGNNQITRMNGTFQGQGSSGNSFHKVQMGHNIKQNKYYFCSNCGRNCNCEPVPGFIRKF